MKKIPALLGGALITVSAASAAIGLTGVRTDIKEFSPRTLVPTEISSKDIKAKGLKPVVKESALTTSSRMSAPAREGSSEGWTQSVPAYLRTLSSLTCSMASNQQHSMLR